MLVLYIKKTVSKIYNIIRRDHNRRGENKGSKRLERTNKCERSIGFFRLCKLLSEIYLRVLRNYYTIIKSHKERVRIGIDSGSVRSV